MLTIGQIIEITPLSDSLRDGFASDYLTLMSKSLWIEFAVLSYDKACQVGATAVENVRAIFLFTSQCNACLIVIGILSCCLLIISCA